MAMEQAAKRRVRAGRMLQAGKKPAEIAAAVGVARQTVYAWKRILEESGIETLREIDRGGRPASLDEEQFEQIRRALLESPTAHGFGTELWTVKRVRLLVERLHGVRFSEVHVWRLLGRLGFSSQKPERRALERARRQSRAGGNASGRGLKKSLCRGQTDRIYRRIGLERAAHARAHLGAQGANPSRAVSFQLEAALDDCGIDSALLLLPFVPGNNQERADRDLP
jgi:transposase